MAARVLLHDSGEGFWEKWSNGYGGLSKVDYAGIRLNESRCLLRAGYGTEDHIGIHIVCLIRKGENGWVDASTREGVTHFELPRP